MDLQRYQDILKNALTDINWPSEPENLYDSMQYILSLGGKRLRPLMVLIACDLLDGDMDDAKKASLVVEMFHNFSLMHDDIMDNAELRRGKPAVHIKWDTPTAILGGDALLVKCYEALLLLKTSNKLQIIELFNKTAIEVCEGQQMDMNFEQLDHVTTASYIEMIRLKTAVLMGASFKMGALIANDTQAGESLYKFGQDLGIAFQIKDDLLDCFGDAQFGKKVGGDIIENKKTYLFLKAKELSKGNDLKRFNSLLNEVDKEAKVEGFKALFTQTGAKEATEKTMLEYYNRSLSALTHLKVDNNKLQMLQSLAKFIWERNN